MYEIFLVLLVAIPLSIIITIIGYAIVAPAIIKVTDKVEDWFWYQPKQQPKPKPKLHVINGGKDNAKSNPNI